MIHVFSKDLLAWHDAHARDLPWRGVRFDVVANHPSREMALEQVLERGRSPMPNIAAPAEGDSFSFVEGRWTRVDYADADEIRY